MSKASEESKKIQYVLTLYDQDWNELKFLDKNVFTMAELIDVLDTWRYALACRSIEGMAWKYAYGEICAIGLELKGGCDGKEW